MYAIEFDFSSLRRLLINYLNDIRRDFNIFIDHGDLALLNCSCQWKQSSQKCKSQGKHSVDYSWIIFEEDNSDEQLDDKFIRERKISNEEKQMKYELFVGEKARVRCRKRRRKKIPVISLDLISSFRLVQFCETTVIMVFYDGKNEFTVNGDGLDNCIHSKHLCCNNRCDNRKFCYNKTFDEEMVEIYTFLISKVNKSGRDICDLVVIQVVLNQILHICVKKERNCVVIPYDKFLASHSMFRNAGTGFVYESDRGGDSFGSYELNVDTFLYLGDDEFSREILFVYGDDHSKREISNYENVQSNREIFNNCENRSIKKIYIHCNSLSKRLISNHGDDWLNREIFNHGDDWSNIEISNHGDDDWLNREISNHGDDDWLNRDISNHGDDDWLNRDISNHGDDWLNRDISNHGDDSSNIDIANHGDDWSNIDIANHGNDWSNIEISYHEDDLSNIEISNHEDGLSNLEISNHGDDPSNTDIYNHGDYSSNIEISSHGDNWSNRDISIHGNGWSNIGIVNHKNDWSNKDIFFYHGNYKSTILTTYFGVVLKQDISDFEDNSKKNLQDHVDDDNILFHKCNYELHKESPLPHTFAVKSTVDSCNESTDKLSTSDLNENKSRKDLSDYLSSVLKFTESNKSFETTDLYPNIYQKLMKNYLPDSLHNQVDDTIVLLNKIESKFDFNSHNLWQEIIVFPITRTEQNGNNPASEANSFMNYEVFRVCSFSYSRFPADFDIWVTQLAQSGFFYVDGKIVCFECGAHFQGEVNTPIENVHSRDCRHHEHSKPLYMWTQGLSHDVLAIYYNRYGSLRPYNFNFSGHVSGVGGSLVYTLFDTQNLQNEDVTVLPASRQSINSANERELDSTDRPQFHSASALPADTEASQEYPFGSHRHSLPNNLNIISGVVVSEEESHDANRSSHNVLTSAARSPVAIQAHDFHSEGDSGAVGGADPSFDLSKASYPLFSSATARRQTFTTWNPNHSHQPDDLVAAGFFYAGYADCVRCFYCGLGLKFWREIDIPAYQHARYRPHCVYNRLFKGQDYIDRVQVDIQSEQTGIPVPIQQNLSSTRVALPAQNRPPTPAVQLIHDRSPAQTQDRPSAPTQDRPDTPPLTAQDGLPATAAQPAPTQHRPLAAVQNSPATAPHPEITHMETLMESSVAQSALQHGWQRPQVQRAVEHIVCEFGENSLEIGLLLDVLRNLFTEPADDNNLPSDDSTDSNDSGITGNQFTPGSLASVLQPQNNVPQLAIEQADGGNASRTQENNQGASAAAPELSTMIKTVQRENTLLNQRIKCRMCQSRTVSCIFLPCGHVIACQECADNATHCVLCGKQIIGTAPVFLS